jgi:hypothetical protein
MATGHWSPATPRTLQVLHAQASLDNLSGEALEALDNTR